MYARPTSVLVDNDLDDEQDEIGGGQASADTDDDDYRYPAVHHRNRP